MPYAPATYVQVIAASNPGCLMQMRAGAAGNFNGPNGKELQIVVASTSAAGLSPTKRSAKSTFSDPWGNTVMLATGKS
jgi:hypothetical protein